MTWNTTIGIYRSYSYLNLKAMRIHADKGVAQLISRHCTNSRTLINVFLGFENVSDPDHI